MSQDETYDPYSYPADGPWVKLPTLFVSSWRVRSGAPGETLVVRTFGDVKGLATCPDSPEAVKLAAGSTVEVIEMVAQNAEFRRVGEVTRGGATSWNNVIRFAGNSGSILVLCLKPGTVVKALTVPAIRYDPSTPLFQASPPEPSRPVPTPRDEPAVSIPVADASLLSTTSRR